jgi:DNA-binding response OmpR family regulator
VVAIDLSFGQFVPELPMNFFRRRFVLIADDNQDLADSLAILLKLVGFDVATVHNGSDAMSVAKSRAPDVLLVDIGLPGLNGYEVAGQFRDDETLKNVLIIAISGYSPDMVRGRWTKQHFDHYLVKPVEFRTLLPLIQQDGVAAFASAAESLTSSSSF